MKTTIAILSSLLISSSALAGVPGSIIVQEPSFECSGTVDNFEVSVEGSLFPVLNGGAVLDGDLGLEGEPITTGVPIIVEEGEPSPQGVPPMFPQDFVKSVAGNMTITFSSLNGLSPAQSQFFTINGSHNAGVPSFPAGEGYKLTAHSALPVLGGMSVTLSDSEKTVLVEKDGVITHDVIKAKEISLVADGLTTLKCDVIDFK